MNLLAIETSSATASLALFRGQELVAERAFAARMALCRNLVREIDALLGGSSLGALDALAVSTGPGSFTSLRIGVVTAKALAHRLGLPIAGVPTLEAIATAAAGEPGRAICVLQPGWKTTVYLAVYTPEETGLLRPVAGPEAVDLDSAMARLSDIPGPLILAGEALLGHEGRVREVLGARGLPAPPDRCAPHARSVAQAALPRLSLRSGPTVHAIRPLYLVPSQAERVAGIDLGLA